MLAENVGLVDAATNASALVELADTFEAEGRAEQAIDLLQRENRRLDDARLEQRLVRLRRAAFAQRSRAPLTTTSYPAPRAPFARDSGLPVATRVELTPEVIRGAVLSAGCLLVRGLFDADAVDRLRALIDAARDASQAFEAGASVGETSPWYDPVEELHGARRCVQSFAQANAPRSGGVLAADSPRGLYRYIELLHELGLDEMIETYLGERPVLAGEKTTLKIIYPHAEKEGWHQDGRFLGEDVRSLNLWVAASDCGVLAPGLDIVAKRLPHIVPTGTDGVVFDWLVSDALVSREYSDSVVRPAFRAGDALFFDHLCLHRTAANGEHMTEARHAIESWFFAASAYPRDKLPLCV